MNLKEPEATLWHTPSIHHSLKTLKYYGFQRVLLRNMVPLARFELTTSPLGGERSIQLSYKGRMGIIATSECEFK